MLQSIEQRIEVHAFLAIEIEKPRSLSFYEYYLKP